MAQGMSAGSRQRVAVVGAGISGLGAAWLVSQSHDVVLYEAEARLGGHARTVDVDIPPVGVHPVDTGFIVFNRVTYPHLCGLFAHLGIPVQMSCMSFAVSVDDGAIEYGSNGIRAILAQPRNAIRPAWWRMMRDIGEFYRSAVADTRRNPGMSVGEMVARRGYGSWFVRHYLLPMGGAIWSQPDADMLDFPADLLTRFFANHGLLSFSGRHQWWTVTGGSSNYIDRMVDTMATEIRLRSPVRAVRRTEKGIRVVASGKEETYDAIILACHTDTALAILKDAKPEERRILGQIRYGSNRIVLHRDTRMMPRRRACWSSWVSLTRSGGHERAAMVSYWMNSLQGLPGAVVVIVTMNPPPSLDQDTILDETHFSHPRYDRAALDAQEALPTINGHAGTWYCGAWTGNGFHEDGLASAVTVARAFGVIPPWI